MRHLTTAGVLFLIAAGVAVGEKVCGTQIVQLSFPGVDEAGLLSNDPELAGGGTLKLCINTKNGKVKQTGSGQVANESGQSQSYKNPPEINVGDVFSKYSYKVKKTGKVKFKGSGVVPPDQIDDIVALIESWS